MKTLKRAMSVIDTSLESAVLIVAVYWVNWILGTRYVRIVSKSIENNSNSIQIALWVLVISFVLLITTLKWIKLKRKNIKVNIIIFIIADIIFIAILQFIIYFLCNKYDIMSILYERMVVT